MGARRQDGRGSMKLFHTTDAADAILSEGFRDGEGLYMTRELFRGVWLADRPLDENEGAKGGDVLMLDIPEAAVAEYEWKQEISFGYREFLVPAEIVNRYPVSRAEAAV